MRAIVPRSRPTGRATFPAAIPAALPVALAAGFFAVYTAISVTRYLNFGTVTFDLGIYEQVVRAYAHLRAPVADIKRPGFVILGDHFAPIVATLAPLYRLVPSPITLVTAQAALIGLSVHPVTRLAVARFGTWPGAAVGAAYGLSWGLQRAVESEFHEIAFAVPLLAFSLERLVRREWWAAAAWCVPLVLVKEDLGCTVAAIGGYLLLKRQYRPGAFLVVFGAAASAVTVLLIIPSFHLDGSYAFWAKMSGGATEGSALSALLGVPERFLLPAVKSWTLFALLSITAMTALRSPLLVIALPTVGWRFTALDPNYWGTGWHYNAVLMPILFIAMIDAVSTMRASPRTWLRCGARLVAPLVLVVALVSSTWLPVRGLLKPETYDPGAVGASADAALRTIPDDVTVESDIGLLTHLTGRTRVFWLGRTDGIDPDYIARDLRPVAVPPSRRGLEEDAGRAHPGAEYRVVFVDAHFAVLRAEDAR